MEKMPIENKKCMTPKFRVSFPQVFQPKQFEDGPAKYSIVMLFDKKTDLTALKKAAFNAATEKWGPKAKWPSNLRMPFRDGDTKQDLMGYEGTIFCSATSKQKPGVVDQARNLIVEGDESFYAGCYARATLIAFAYDTKGNKGVAFSLQNIQKLADGEAFSGKKKAEDEFDSVEDESDNKANYDGDDSDDVSALGL